MDDVDLEKYKILYEHQKNQFEKEVERFRRLEEKATKYFGSMTIAVGAYLFLVRWAVESLPPAKNLIDWLVMASIAVTFASFMSSWSFSFRATKLSDIIRMPSDTALIGYFSDNLRGTVLLGLSRRYSEAIVEIEKIYKYKLYLVRKTYSEIKFTAWSLTVSVTLISASQWSN
ncbi:hypothetical protein V2I80_25765 [Pseudomonas viridiflava]|uniref:hypothetical protein n=1 Tax=Pseudomonas viridiflava TaxID=33069 RepID=UPI002EB57C1B|nr:hypothetical protein [Pseudomonas viridiflava]MEE3973772.1 hypothetical protein [Pseudomonas viridiflava]MEE4018674.1 hypothetical protein [Pseudomonas viridiflava]MEE4048871.1 hypothetical protein [Pseudomonas viridiflava]